MPADAVPPDADLVIAVRDGDREAFTPLVERYQKKVLWLCYQMVHNWDEASELAQEAFTRAYRSLDRFDCTKHFYTWLARIAVNVSIDALRRRARMRLLSDDALAMFPADGAAPDAGLLADERRRQVHAVLARLPEKYRSILILKDVEGMPGKDIAELLEVDYQTVRWRIHHARKLFKEQWERAIEPST